MIGECRVGELIERADLHIGRELIVPHLRIELREPTAELGEFWSRKRGDFVLKLLHFRHAFNIPNVRWVGCSGLLRGAGYKLG